MLNRFAIHLNSLRFLILLCAFFFTNTTLAYAQGVPPQTGTSTDPKLNQEFFKRFSTVFTQTQKEQLELADWCKEKNLPKYANLVYHQTTQLRQYLRTMKTRRGAPSPDQLLKEFEDAFGPVEKVQAAVNAMIFNLPR